jgi:AAA+ superfamily predicted ATPase
MMKREYYYIYVVFDNKKNISFESLPYIVDKFNSYLHYMYFDTVLKNGVLRFIYFKKGDGNVNDTVSELSDMFEAKVSIEPLDPSDLKSESLCSFNIAKQFMLDINEHYHGEIKYMWDIKKSAEVAAEVNALDSFDDFKLFFNTLHLYCNNVKKRGVCGIYNVALINECGTDGEKFVNYIYNLYSAEHIIKDHCIISGNLRDAVHTKRDTAFLYYILRDNQYDWSKSNFLDADDEIKAFTTLSKRNTVYVTTMSKAEYARMQMLDEFRMFFTHIGYLKEPSENEKLVCLSNLAKTYGFSLDGASFKGNELLRRPLNCLSAALITSINSNMLQAADNSDTFVLRAKDLLPEAKVPIESYSYTAYEELQKMVGLTEIKTRMSEIATFIKRRGKDSLPCLHMVFRGNPGTGKTTAARLIGRIFAESGILRNADVFVEADRESLIGKYVGHTAAKTAEKIREAMGGILFIDEAYSLGTYEKGLDYGDEAISTLVKMMEDHRKDFICIMAGYTEEMDKMLDVNPGLRDRIQFYIDFPDYNEDELTEIFMMLCANAEYELAEGSVKTMRTFFRQITGNKNERFSNARLARKIFERVRVKQALREESNIIIPDDIKSVFAEKDMSVILKKNKSNCIGF